MKGTPKRLFVVKVAFHATSKALSVPAKDALGAALVAGAKCRDNLTRPISYLVSREGINQLALTEAEMQGLRNREIIAQTQLAR